MRRAAKTDSNQRPIGRAASFYQENKQMSDKKNTNTQDTHKETADKAEEILKGTKK